MQRQQQVNNTSIHPTETDVVDCRGKDSRSNLDNLANAALMASRVERAELAAHTVPAPAVATAGKGSSRSANRPPKKKARSGSVSGGAVSGGPSEAATHSPARTSVSNSPARTISGQLSAGGAGFGAKLASGSEPAVTSRHVAHMQPTLAPVLEYANHPAGNSWQTDQAYPEGASFSAAQPGNVPIQAVGDMMHDPVAAAIKNATDAITTDGALQASGELAVHGLNTQPQLSHEVTLPLQAGNASTDQTFPQQMQVSYHPSNGQMTMEAQQYAVTHPMGADGTVTITTSQTTPEGATMLVRQSEGLLIVRDPQSGKEQCLGKLLCNSAQTSRVLQAANFLEPCSN